ncbi:MAG TPA: transcription antitermination factor NusB, partial [Clostridia bacterium]|nr:transcription antitermination factor NusB [Clostridia bacterium]
MGRRKTREHALRLVYQIQINDDDINEQMEQYFLDNDVKNTAKEYIKKAVTYINENCKDIDSVLSMYLAKNWRIERIPKIELAIMRLAYYEILNLEDVPKSVAINEAV